MLTLLPLLLLHYNATADHRSLKEFDAAVAKHGTRLAADILIQHHLDILYDQLLESNLMKIIEPFSCVEIARVAELIHLPLDKVTAAVQCYSYHTKKSCIIDLICARQLLRHREHAANVMRTVLISSELMLATTV
jgi:PCI domain